MNADRSLERDIAELFERTAPRREPGPLLDRVLTSTSRAQPRPRWQTLLKESPMRYQASLTFGSPTARLVTVLLASTLLAALGISAAVAGASVLTSPPPTLPSVASNGVIAVDGEGDILITDADGSDPRKLTSGPDTDINPAFSPDGEWLAFWSTPADGGGARLAVMRPDGKDRRDIEAAPGWLFQTAVMGTPNISWSTDGHSIATIVAGAAGMTIAVVDVASGALTPLDIEPLGATVVAWSPDGQWLAYVGQWVGREVYLMHPDGSGERSISPVADDAPSYLSIDWSPDSRLVTYARHADDESGYRVYAVDIGTATETLLTPETPSGTDHWWPTYSPDGAGLASGGGDQSGAAVFVGGADGSGWRQLELAQGVSTEDVTWSPDGRSILVFEHSFDSLLVVPVDDPGAAVAIPTGGSAGSPSWQRRPA